MFCSDPNEMNYLKGICFCLDLFLRVLFSGYFVWLIRDGLWNIVNGTEIAPHPTESQKDKDKYDGRRDRALATNVSKLN